MDEFIQQAMQKLGTNADSTRALTGGLLNVMQREADGGTFGELKSKLPGAEALMKAQDEGNGGGASNMLGSVMSKAGSTLGGNVGTALNLSGLFQKSGLGAEQAGSFVSMFVEFLKGKAGASLVQKVLGQVPELAKLVG